MAYAALQVRDTRRVFLALALLAISGLLLAHALTTPGVIVSCQNPWFGTSASFSLTFGEGLSRPQRLPMVASSPRAGPIAKHYRRWPCRSSHPILNRNPGEIYMVSSVRYVGFIGALV